MTRSVTPLARRPSRHSASAAALPSFSTPTGRPKRPRSAPGQVDVVQGQVRRAGGRRPSADRCSAGRRTRSPPRRPRARRRSRRRGREHLLLRVRRASGPRSCADRAVAVDDAGEDLRPAEVDSDNPISLHARLPYPPGCPNRRSPTGSTRAVGSKGRVPLERRLGQRRPGRSGRPQPEAPRRRKRRRAGRGSRTRARRADCSAARRRCGSSASYSLALERVSAPRTTACPPASAGC